MKKFIIDKNFTIKKTLSFLNKSGYKSLIVVENLNNKKFLGTISDGDIRKAILKGHEITEKIISIYNKKPIFLEENKYDKAKIKKIFLSKKIAIIPIVNSKKKICNIFLWDDFFKNNINNKIKLSNTPVVIMAGGKGVRLEPFTKVLPKPLIPINEKPIIDHIMEKFVKFGTSKFFLSVNYKSKILKAYFDEIKHEYKVEFVEESKPLGTVGSLSLLTKKIKETFFVTNCDIMIDIDYVDFLKFHKDNKNHISFIVFPKKFTIPYGICNTDKSGNFSKINEKQSYDFLINGGLYILEPQILKLIPINKMYHMTDLIKKAKNKKYKIGIFHIKEDSWMDVGQWNEYKNVINKF